MNSPEAYLNGRFVPASALAVSPVDAGFVLGATVAEQLRTFGGKLFRLDDHIERLRRSLKIVDIDPGVPLEQLAGVARELVARNHRLLDPADDLGLAIFVTPGIHASYALSGDSRQPTVCLHTYPLPFFLWADKYCTGQSLLVGEFRQVPPDCWPPGLKCRSRMHYYLADRRAAQHEPGARALLLDHDGLVSEASTANVLIYTVAGGLVSPPAENILRGISLDVVGRLADRLAIPFGQRDLRVEEVAAADEVLLSSTPLCLLPVTRLDGRPIGPGAPGTMFGRLLRAWSDEVGLDIAAQALRFADRRGMTNDE